jgi:carboxylate-amine ligase
VGARPSFTLGIEEEFQLIEPETRALKSHILELFAEGESRLKEKIKKEMHQSVVEVGTGICADIAAARADVTNLRRELIKLAGENGLAIAAAGTHPFTHWSSIAITPNERYEQIVFDLGMVARANLIFGLHVHVAVEDDEARIAIQNSARYLLPHVFALSTNSPFWCGTDTGWKSYRAKVFERFPRTGIPDNFYSWGDYQRYVATLVKTGCIDNPKKIWWDVRPHPFFPTLEYRICDIPMRVDETICLAALFQAITVKLWKLYDRNLSFRSYTRALISENRNRAARFGIDGKLIDFGTQEEVPLPHLIEELLELVDDVLDELGSRREVEYVHEILRRRTGADRQREVYERTGSLPAVVDYIVEETRHGL